MSMFSRCSNYLDNDPFEEIFALNLGDFLVEHLISDELAEKIKVRIKAEPQNLKAQLKELISIYSINNTLNLLGFNNKEDFIIYNAIAKTMVKMLDVDFCHIFLSKKHMRGTIEKELFLAGSSIDICVGDYDYSKGYNLDENSPVVETFKTHGLGIFNCYTDIKDSNNIFNQSGRIKHIELYPICNKTMCVGVIAVEKEREEELSISYRNLVNSIALLFTISLQLQVLTEEATIVINSKEPELSVLKHLRAELTVLIGDLGDEQQVFVERLAEAVDEKGTESNTHSRNTATIAQRISNYLNLNEKTKDLIYYAALLQNIGRIILPQKLFQKKDSLTAEEFNILSNSTNTGVNILMKINFLSEVIPYINYYKERWDGRGCPEGLSGQSIPLGSRIIAVADAYCALREKRAYREPFDDEKALRVISEESGIKWDPLIVEALQNIDRINL